MNKFFLLLTLTFATYVNAGPFVPAAGQSGSTAIDKDSSLFIDWATGWQDYIPGTDLDASFKTPDNALGKAVGDTFDIVSLGNGGRITLTFDRPIANGSGDDFAVFENSFSNTFLELAWVEVSSNGTDFFRFKNYSYTPAKVTAFGSIDPTNIHGLAGKYQQGYGTPFDLNEMVGISDLLDVNNIGYVRIKDIIGIGAEKDSLNKPIYDPYKTVGSAGFDLEAIGVINQAAKNVAPSANAGQDQSVVEENNVSLQGSGSDSDGNIVAYEWSQTSGPLVTLSATNTATPSFVAPSVSADTTLQFKLVVIDDKGASSEADTLQIIVTQRNFAPVVDAGSERSVVEEANVSLQASASDADGSITAYQWSQLAGPMVELLGADTASPSFVAPSISADTTLQFRLVVIDDKGKSSDADTVQITVCNRETSGCKPTAVAGNDRSASVGEVVSLDGTASLDPQNQTLNYQWRQVSGPQVNLSDPNDPQPMFTSPMVTANTLLSFKLNVTDTDGNISDADTVNIVINVVNTAPTAEIPTSMNLRAGATLILDGGASYDPENDQLNYFWEQTAGPSVTLSSQIAEKPSAVLPLNLLGQTLTFKLTVSDGFLQSSKETTVTVNANSTPTVSLEAQPVTAQNQLVALHALAQDPDGDQLHFVWEQTEGVSVSLDGADSAELRFTTPTLVAGTSAFLTFKLTVTDDFSAEPLSASAEIKIMVTEDGTLLDCSTAKPSRASLWPATKGFKAVSILDITGPNPYAINIEAITQDEPLRDKALKDTTGPDAKVVKPKATARKPKVKQSVLLRAERQGTAKKNQPFSGNGRIYRIRFRADDGFQNCAGTVSVQVPPDKDGTAVLDTTGEYDSTKR